MLPEYLFVQNGDKPMTKDSNRELAEQRHNMGKDPGNYYSDLSAKYQNDQQYHNRHSSGCFHAETEILTPVGWVQIQYLESSSPVLSYSVDKGCLVERAIIKKKENKNHCQIWEVKLACSEIVVKTTRDHSFLCDRGWVTTRKLKPGDTVLWIAEAGTIMSETVASVSPTKEHTKVYNLVTYHENNFIAKGMVAHNFTFCRTLRSIASNVVFDLSVSSFNQKLV